MFPVEPETTDLFLDGLPDVIEIDSDVELTCTVKRIKPQSAYLQWEINGHASNGRITTTIKMETR